MRAKNILILVLLIPAYSSIAQNFDGSSDVVKLRYELSISKKSAALHANSSIFNHNLNTPNKNTNSRDRHSLGVEYERNKHIRRKDYQENNTSKKYPVAVEDALNREAKYPQQKIHEIKMSNVTTTAAAVDLSANLNDCSWEVRVQDATLRRSLENWSMKAGWQPYWDLTVDFPVELNAKLCGTFENAVEQVLTSLAQSDAPVRAIFYTGNRVVRFVSASK